jgi:hypothetical protein
VKVARFFTVRYRKKYKNFMILFKQRIEGLFTKPVLCALSLTCFKAWVSFVDHV